MQCGRHSQSKRFHLLIQNWEHFEKTHHPLMLSRQSLAINLPRITPDFLTDYAVSLDSLSNELALLDTAVLVDAEKMQFELFSNYIHREHDWYANRQAWQTDLWFYVEIIGNEFYHPMQAQLTEYDKIMLITARLEQLPAFLAQIRANVPQPDGSQSEAAAAAIGEIQNYLTRDFLNRGRKLSVQPENFSTIYRTAVSELDAWQKVLLQQLAVAEKSPRLGEIELDRRLNLWFGDDVNSQQMLSLIALEKKRIFPKLLNTAAEVYHRYYPKRRLNLAAVRNNPAILKRAFTKIQGEKIPPALWPEEIRYSLKIIRQFLDLRDVFPLTSLPSIDILWLPPHLRILYTEKIDVCYLPTGMEWQLYLPPVFVSRGSETLSEAVQGEFNQYMLKNLAVELIPGSVLQSACFVSM